MLDNWNKGMVVELQTVEALLYVLTKFMYHGETQFTEFEKYI